MKQNKEIPAGYKDSTLGIIPEDWEVKKLSQISEIDSISLGSNTSSDYEFEYISLSDVDSAEFQIETTKQVFKSAPSRARRVVSKGDIIMSTVRPNLQGFSIIKSEVKNLIASTGFAVISATKCNNEYLFNMLFSSSISKQIYQVLVGSNYPAINSSDVKNLKFAISPLKEQDKIAKILGTWDEAIEKQQKLIEKLEKRKRVLIQQLLSGNIRLPGYSSPWHVYKLNDIGEFTKGFGVPKDKIIDCGQKAITYGEIYTKHNVIIKCFVSFIDEYTASQSQLIEKGDILFAGSGETLEDIGKCVAYIDDGYAFAGGDIIIYKPKSVNSIVLSYILNSPCVIRQKRQMGQGHSIVHIYAKSMSKIKVSLPPIEEQNSIAKVLINIDKEIDIVKELLTSIRIQKNGLIQQLLTGKRRVNP